MNNKAKYTAVALIFIWIGFVSSISFMEAWLKFRAPGLTLPVGLSVGKLIFTGLNRVEWIFALLIGVCLVLGKRMGLKSKNILFYLALIILALHTAWLLPALNSRADIIISGKQAGSSLLHVYYVGFELIKLSFLAIFGIRLLKTNTI